jgi:hypothetical protein
MIELVLVYCMVAAPDRCVERREFFDHPLSETECVYNAQEVGGHYVETHQQWRLSRWRCERDKPRETPI